MKLTDLSPRWVGAGGEGIRRADGSPAPERTGVGVAFDCPSGCDEEVYVAFAEPLDGGAPVASAGQPLWNRTGDTFEVLTLRPSILRVGGCGWHGFVTGGDVTTA